MSTDKPRAQEKRDKVPSVAEQEKPSVSDYKSEENIEVGKQRIELSAGSVKNAEQQSQAVCDECGKSFETLTELTQHYRQAHPESYG